MTYSISIFDLTQDNEVIIPQGSTMGYILTTENGITYWKEIDINE